MTKKNVTTDQLAVMIEKGFEASNKRTDKKVNDLAVMVKKGFDGVDKNFKEVYRRFDNVNKGFDRIENVLIKQHSEEIEYLKRRVTKLEESLAIE